MQLPWYRRRAVLIAGVSIAGLITAALILYGLYPRIGAWAIRKKVIARLEKKLDRDVSVGDIQVTRGGKAVLKDVIIKGPRDGNEPLAHIARVIINYDFWASVHGAVRVSKVRVEGLRAVAVRNGPDNDNFSDIVRRFRKRPGKRKRRISGGLRPEVVVLAGGSFRYDDATSGVSLAGEKLAAVAKRGGVFRAEAANLRGRNELGQTGGVDKVVLTADLHHLIDSAQIELAGGRVRLWRGMSLTGIAGTVAKGAAPGRLVVDLAGGYGGARGQLWDAKGWVDPRKASGSLALRADRFTFDRIKSVMARTPVVVDYADTSVNVAVNIDVSRAGLTFRGDMSLGGLNIYHPKLADGTLRNLEVAGKVRGGFDRKSRTLHLDSADMTSHGVAFSASGSLSLPGGIDPDTGERRERKRLAARLVVPPVPCQTVLDAFPDKLLPHVQGFELGGTFKTNLHVDVDMARLDDTVLEGSVGIRGCKVKKAPKPMNVKRLKKEFVHYAEVQNGKWIPIVVGESNPDYVPLWDVSPYVVKAFLTTEDGRFFRHHGFIIHEFRSALIKNLKAGYFKYGASSITMQIVKNVMLYRAKTLSRKLEELFLTWYIETVLTKDRLMEIYVNVIEYGPGIYGIGRAAQHYFAKHPREINPVEAAFFSTILPSPKRRYKQYCHNKPSRWTMRYIATILKIMLKRNHITQEVYDEYKDEPLVFNRNLDDVSVRQCQKDAKRAMAKAKAKHPIFAP